MSFVAIEVYPLFNSPLEQARKPRSYASSKLRACDLLTGVKCRATSVAKNAFSNQYTYLLELFTTLQVEELFSNPKKCQADNVYHKSHKYTPLCKALIAETSLSSPVSVLSPGQNF